jgi:hypothetical protein
VTSRANPENEPKTTTHHRKSEHGSAGKQIKAVDLASIRAANRTPTGKGWCGRKDGEQKIHGFRIRVDFVKKFKSQYITLEY